MNQLSDGTTQLTDNSGALTDGTSQLKDGSKKLADGLTDGYKQVNNVKLTKQLPRCSRNQVRTSRSG
ncbi:hypothetical protein [Lacticaseibacillus sharpeae]|uniref:hypothetical protein n=1 Tax=Lacticaseibacillus sharpeae TaxID=1626 RepID=UPI0006D2C943|nr:hypothetical protein [Lacticaseibacillus sharpeae]